MEITEDYSVINMHRIIVNVLLLCTAAMVKGNNRGRGQSGGGRSYVFIPNTASQQGYSGSSMFMTGLSEFIAGYLAICDTDNTCVSELAMTRLRECSITVRNTLSQEVLQRIRGCASCCTINCSPANVIRFPACFAQLAPQFGPYLFSDAAICCYRRYLSIGTIQCLIGLYPQYAPLLSGLSVVNTVVFTGARKALLTVTPSFLRSFLVESLATIELCADCAELGVVWEVHGNAGYALALFACCMWWAYFWYDAEACPAGPIEDCFLIGAKFTQWSIVSKLIGQAVGAYFTWRYVQWFWKFHLIPQHVTLNMLPCQAGLQCSMVYGALIEALISFISRFVCLESGYLPQLACAAVNSITTVGLCLFAMDSSGGYFNPILASALTLNCKGNNFFEHLFVYWVASLTGGIIARTIHLLMRGATLVPKDKDD